MVRNGTTVEAHQWSQATQSWTKLGEVVDAVGSSRKQVYNGREYDYVFDVDIAEGAPPLKLPYNSTGMSGKCDIHQLIVCRQPIPSGPRVHPSQRATPRISGPSGQLCHPEHQGNLDRIWNVRSIHGPEPIYRHATSSHSCKYGQSRPLHWFQFATERCRCTCQDHSPTARWFPQLQGRELGWPAQEGLSLSLSGVAFYPLIDPGGEQD